MRYRMLGELEVVDGDADVPIRGAKQRALLLLLLVHARETVQAERLADELWGDAPPAGGANALQALVSKLRRALGAGSDALTTASGGYRLDVADDDIDARAFALAVETGRTALAGGEPAVAAEVLADALAMWRGRALDGDSDEGVLRREAARLEELRWTVLEDRIDADLQRGGGAELVAEVEHLVAEEPLRERMYGFLMLALYRAGRQAEALRTFQRARDVLGEELGLDPGPELRSLESAILAHDPDLVLPETPRVVVAPRRTNLTPALSSFIGRAGDVRALDELVDHQRLVTVVGPGGAGKTRLAHEVAGHRFAVADVWMVELAALGDPAAVTDAVVTGIGVPDRQLLAGGAPADGPALDRVVEHVADRDTLLLLDNCEHVIGEAARLAEHLLQACPRLRIVATSREPLGIGGESIWLIPPMSPTDAAALFVDRARAAGLDATDDAGAAVDDLCVRLDGLPLAIELAAARARIIPVQQLTSRLDDRFRLLTGGARTALPRHQTLRAVVEWSYELLFAEEQELFDRLSVFAGGCTLEAAEAIGAGGDIEAAEVVDILTRLVDKSLVTVDRSGAEARFHLLQTLSLYGRERLAARGDAERTSAVHAAFYGELCERGPAAFRGTGQADWLRTVRREAHNIRAALGWLCDQGDAEAALALAGGLGWAYWLTEGGEEGVRLLLSALACPGPSSLERRAFATMWASAVMSNAGTGLDRAVELGEQAVALWAETGDQPAMGEAMALLGGVYVMRGDRDVALGYFDRGHEIFASAPDHWGQAVATSCAGRAATMRNDLATAERYQRESVAHFEAAGVTWAACSVNSDVALLADLRGHLDAAEVATTKALDAARSLHLGLAEAQLLARLGNIALERGDTDAAERLHDEALAVGERVGATLSVAFARNGRGVARRRAGLLDEAAASAAEALGIYLQAGASIHEAYALSTLGLVAEQQGRLDEAERFHQQGLALVGRLGDGRATALALEGLAGVAVARGEHEHGATLLGRAEALRREASDAPPPVASDRERISAAAVAALGETAFAAAVERGAAARTDDLVEPAPAEITR